MYILASLFSAIMIGAGDFFGGLSSKKAPVALVCLIGQAVGLVVVVLLTLITRQEFSQQAFISGLGAGSCGSIAILAIYRGLAVGRVSIVAPLSALLGALLPVLVAILTGQSFGILKWMGVVSGLMAVYFLSLPAADDSQNKETGLVHAIVGGSALAGFYMLLGNSENHGSLSTLVGERITVCTLMLLAVLFRKQFVKTENKTMIVTISAGVADVLGNLAFLYASTCGPLPMVALLSSLYPAFTLVLGWTLLKEPLNRKLAIGIVFAFICITLFGLPY